MTRALTHFFGSTDGYRTLARAPGVTDAEDAALASLGFGSPRTQSDFDALEAHPCMAGRMLPSGRFAITRVFPGEPDVAGRQTVERRTLILDAAGWAALLAADLAGTLERPDSWLRERFAAGEPVELEACAGDDLLPEPGDDERRAFDALLEAQRTGRCATLPDDARWRRALLRLGGFLPRERIVGFGWGIGLWAVPAGVWIASLRPDAQPRHSFVAPLDGPLRNPEEVARLGAAPTSAGETARTRRASNRRERRPLAPWMLGAGVALLMIVVALWWTLSGKPSADTPVKIARATDAPVPALVAPAPEPAPQPAPPAPPPTGPAAPAAASATASPAASATAPTASASSFGAASPERSFGSGDAPSTSATTPAPKPAPATPAAETPPAAPTVPAAPAAPAPKPDPPIPSAPWDPEVALLRESIDLATETRAFAAGGGADSVAALELAQRLVATGARVRLAANKLGSRLSGEENRQRLFYADALYPATPREEYGISRAVLESLAVEAVPNSVPTKIALLMARFELAQAGKLLLVTPAGKTDEVTKSMKSAGSGSGWPTQSPFENWIYWRVSGSNTSSEQAEVFMASSFAEKFVGRPELRGLFLQLKRVVDAPAPGGARSTGAAP